MVIAAVALAIVVLAVAVVVGSSPRRRVSGPRDEARVGAQTAVAPTHILARNDPSPSVLSRPPEAGGDSRRRLEVPLADRPPATLPVEGAPAGWILKEFAGRSEVDLRRSEGRLVLRLRSDRASFALHRDVTLDLAEFPVLTWAWNVARLPTGGDVRLPLRDDQAAQLYVIFPRWPSPLTRSDVIGYVWDTTAPVGTRLTSGRAANVKIIVVESGGAELGAWRRFERNVADDYATLFGRKAPRPGKLALMIDSNDTRSDAEAMVAGIAFLGATAAR